MTDNYAPWLRSGLSRDERIARINLDPATAVSNPRALMLLSIRDSTERPPLGQEIFDELAIAVIEGRLRPGDTLNSVELSRRFGTSRTPVREALASLEMQGVISIPARRRPFVTRPTLKHVRDLYQLRASLFALVSELIVDSHRRPQLSELWAWQAALEEDAERDLVDDYFWHNVGFRLVETKLAGNGELQRAIGSLGIRTLQFRHLSLSQPGRLSRSVEDHRRLLIAYEEGDRQAAVAMSRSLIMAGYGAIERSGMIETRNVRVNQPRASEDMGKADVSSPDQEEASEPERE